MKVTRAQSRFARPTNIQERFDLEAPTAFGGAGLLIDHACRTGLLRRLKDALGLGKRCDAIFSLAEVSFLLVLGRILGLDRVRDFISIEQEPMLCAKLGRDRLPDHTTYYRDLRRLGDIDRVSKLRALVAERAGRVFQRAKSVVLDFDSTVETVFGQQEGAAVGYNPRYPGRPSYHPIAAIVREHRVFLCGELRPGNAHTAACFPSLLTQALGHLPRRVRQVVVCLDKGFDGDKNFRALEHAGSRKRHVHYITKLHMRPEIRDTAASVRFRSIDDTGEVQVGWSYHRAHGWCAPRRVVFVRQRLHLPENDLFRDVPRYELDAYVTDLDWDEQDIWMLYRHRATIEQVIKDVKGGLALTAVPTSDFAANDADFVLKMLAANVLRAYAHDLFPASLHNRSTEMLRELLLRLPGVVVRHARAFSVRLRKNLPQRTLLVDARRLIPTLAPS